MFGKSNKEVSRSEKFKTLCRMKGMEYLDIDEFGTKAYLQGFELFRYGNGKIRNLCQQKSPSLDAEIYILDYKYTIYTGKSSATFDQTVFFVNSKKLGLPAFYLKPEHWGHKIAALLGWEDIDFEQYPAFSEKYHLSGENQDFIRHTFNDQVLKYFSKTSGWTIEAANYYLIFYSHNSLMPETILPDFFRLGMGIFDMFKTSLPNTDAQ
jgi:hypothetical protein